MAIMHSPYSEVHHIRVSFGVLMQNFIFICKIYEVINLSLSMEKMLFIYL